MQERAEAGRPLSHLFIEVSVDAQPLIDRFMRREAGADAALESMIQNYAGYPDGFFEVLESARDSNTRIVAMDLPMHSINTGGRQAQSNPYWAEVIRREMASSPDGQFLVLAGAGHNDPLSQMLNIPSFTVLDVHGADLINTVRREELASSVPLNDSNFLESTRLPPISNAQIEGSILTGRITQTSPREFTVIVPDIQGYDYESRAYMLSLDGVTDRSPLTADLDVYRRLNDIIYNDTLNPTANSTLQQILERLAAPGQASTDVLQSQRLGDQIEHLADLGNFTPRDVTALRDLANDVKER